MHRCITEAGSPGQGHITGNGRDENNGRERAIGIAQGAQRQGTRQIETNTYTRRDVRGVK
jgi:hypothetical protein